MVKLVIGIVLSTLVIFAWGFLYWGATTLPYQNLQRATDETAAQTALREYFPNSGSYLLPSNLQGAEVQQRLLQQGPHGFLHLSYLPSSATDPSTLLRGLLLNLTFATLLAAILHWLRYALPTFLSRVSFSFFLGLAAVVLIDLGQVVWWGTPPEWQLWQAFYNLSATVLAGAVLAPFVARVSI